MKILHINTSSSRGGAAIAAFRITEAMMRAGKGAHLLAKTGVELPLTTVLTNNVRDRIWEYSMFKITDAIRKPYMPFSFMAHNYGIEHIKEVQEADVVYLHWVNNFLGFRDIDWLLKEKKRVVWYMHDMWPMTGGCHHSLSCVGYHTDCKGCNQLLKLSGFAHYQLKKKMNHWLKADNLVIAAPSQWLTNKAAESSLFGEKKIFTCPNVLDTTVFKPTDRQMAKDKVGLDYKKKYVLFGASVGLKNPFKGMKYLYDALLQLNPKYEILLMGHPGDDYPKELKERTHIMGYVTDDRQKVDIYNASDVFVLPSIAENYPNMVIEAMACGIPVVGFKIGGVVEQITHMYNGFLAETMDSMSLREGVEWVLGYENQEELSQHCREFVCDNCSYEMVLQNHRELLLI